MNIDHFCLLAEPVGKARASFNVANEGDEVWARLTENDDMEFHLDNGKTIEPNQISFHATFNKAKLRGPLEGLREKYRIFKKAHLTRVLSEPELMEISGDMRLLNTGLAICGANGILDKFPITQDTEGLLPKDYLHERAAAFEILEKLKAQYPEVGAQLNPYAAARASGYSMVVQDSFSDKFFDVQGPDDFHLDVYVIRACAAFWASPVAGKPDGFAKRLHYDEEDGITGLAKALAEQLRDGHKLIKPSWMTQQRLNQYKPVLTSLEQLRKLMLLSPIFSTLFGSPPKDQRESRYDYQHSVHQFYIARDSADEYARLVEEAEVYLVDPVYTPGWRDIIAKYLDPGEHWRAPQETRRIPEFPPGSSEALETPETSQRREEYYGHVTLLGAYGRSTALAMTLAGKLKASIYNEAAFDKWRGAIDECLAEDHFKIPAEVWHRHKTFYTLFESDSDSDDE